MDEARRSCAHNIGISICAHARANVAGTSVWKARVGEKAFDSDGSSQLSRSFSRHEVSPGERASSVAPPTTLSRTRQASPYLQALNAVGRGRWGPTSQGRSNAAGALCYSVSTGVRRRESCDSLGWALARADPPLTPRLRRASLAPGRCALALALALFLALVLGRSFCVAARKVQGCHDPERGDGHARERKYGASCRAGPGFAVAALRRLRAQGVVVVRASLGLCQRARLLFAARALPSCVPQATGEVRTLSLSWRSAACSRHGGAADLYLLAFVGSYWTVLWAL
ncbi:hypothetical protein C8Q78DRAFT_570355 [Trametes maxima]|nr:hypothetical protein C8Q78DRAFT_570355 [Trametes maxima]